jgi:hypothetical protein
MCVWIDDAGQSEVQDLRRAIIGYYNISGFQISVDSSLAMGVRQGIC